VAQTPATVAPLVQQPSPAAAQGSTDQRAAEFQLSLLDIGQSLKAKRTKETIAQASQLITALTAGGQVLQPESLTQAYEYRGHARMAQGEVREARQDYLSLLKLAPNYQLNANLRDLLKDITTTTFEIVSSMFEEVKKVTLGQIVLSMTPPGKVEIGGRPYDLDGERKTITLVAGDYPITVTRPGYDPLTRTFRVEPARVAEPVDLRLERLVSTLSLVSTPPGVDVILDGNTRYRTARADGMPATPTVTDLQLAADSKAAIEGAPASAPLGIPDLQPTKHTLVLRAPCYQEFQWDFTIARESEKQLGTILPGDLTQTFKLIPATAKLQIQGAEPQTTLFFDGTTRPVAADPLTVCAGSHWIEVRGPLGRFIDRHEWKAGEERQLKAVLRSAFAIVSVTPEQTLSPAQLSALEGLKEARVLAYIPYDQELAEASKEPGGTPEFWTPNATGGISREGKLERWSKLAQRLQAQGLAALTTTADPATVVLSLLGPNSFTPTNITINTVDPTSTRSALEMLSAAPVRFWKPSLDAVVVDVEGTPGAVVARLKEGGAAQKAGLKPGDTIVSLDGVTIASAADLLTKISTRAPASAVTLQVKSLGTTDARPLAITLSVVPEANPSSRVPNLALVDLHAALQRSSAGSVERAAAQLNLGIVHMELKNLEEAKKAFEAVPSLGDGPGVSDGTVAYWKGLCHEQLGNALEARVQFSKAADAKLARLSVDGPLVSPLAKLKLAAMPAK